MRSLHVWLLAWLFRRLGFQVCSMARNRRTGDWALLFAHTSPAAEEICYRYITDHAMDAVIAKIDLAHPEVTH